MPVLPWKAQKPKTFSLDSLPGVEIPDHGGLLVNESELLIQLTRTTLTETAVTEIITAYCLAYRLSFQEPYKELSVAAETIFTAGEKGYNADIRATVNEVLPPQPRTFESLNSLFDRFSARPDNKSKTARGETEGK